ncbi:MAG: peptidylprolyl isomerase [Phycisphaerae bacterium]|nr:peptidylprolyl isomerase [Phycisphaerae bacterium]
MASATARHILVDTEEQCEDIKVKIADGADFADMAKEHSNCPSGKSGGDLGSFTPGQMVKEFDVVVFSETVGVIHGPVKTQFGYHLIEITSRVD